MKKNLLKNIFIILTILLPFGLKAQTGPAGVGNSSGINGQPANELWFDASSLGLTNGDLVSNWLDKSGNNNNGEQLSTSSQPIYYDQTNVNYNYPIVFFDGTDDFIPFDGNVIAGKDYTLFVVAQRRSNGYMKSVLMGGTNPGTNKDLHFHLTSSQLRNHHYGNDLQSPLIVNTDPVSSGTDINEFGIFATRLGSTESDPYRKNFQNNRLLVKAHANNSKLISWDGAALARYDGGTAYYSELEIAEAIIFSSALNLAQLEIINNYLSEKYNIVIDNDLYTAPTNFNLEVAGIGNRSNFKHSRSSSAGVYFNERDNTLDDGEFIFTSHNATENNETNINRSTQVTATSAVAAWGREWYMAQTASASVDVQLVFDFKEAFTNGKYPQNPENYVLLWRANQSDDFTETPFILSGIADVDQVYFNVNAANFQDGYYTLGTKDETLSPLQGVNGRTWYALKSGVWNDWETWTLDPSGNLPNNPAHELPSDNLIDKVVIHSGKTVTVNINNIKNNQLTVDGRIDFAETKNQQFDIIKGSGRILLAEDNFPTGDASHFISKGQGEGTVIFYGASDTLYIDREYYNLEIELNSDIDTLTLLSNNTLNGNFEIKKGVVKIGNEQNTNILNFIVKGNFTIDALGEIRTGKGKTIARNLSEDYTIPTIMPKTDGKTYHSIYHQVEIWGDFTNNGIARFTNLDAPIYNQFAPNGVTVRFKGMSNNIAELNGITDFYNLIIDKGTDQTYILDIYSSAQANFGLYGANNVGRNESAPFSSSNPEVRKALFIQNGTLKLTGLLTIPTLSEGSQAGGNGDYLIGANAQLWLAGNVNVYSTANDASTTGNTQVADASGASVTTGSSNQAMSVMGKFRISDGVFGTRNSAGFIFWSSADAQVNIEGGLLYVAQFRSSGSGGGKASFKQTSGIIYLEGNNNGGEFTGSFPIFGLDTKDCVFQMSGGEIIIQDDNGSNTPEFYVPSAAGNYYVTGGTVRFELPNTRSAQLYSTANLWNLELANTTGSGNTTIFLDTTLTVSNDLTIGNFSEFNTNDIQSGNIHNLEIKGNFTIEHDGIYTDNTSTTTFSGNKNSLLSFNNRYLATTDDEQIFYRMVIDKTSDKKVSLASGKTGSALNSNNNNLLRIEGPAFILKSGILDNGNYSVRLYTDTLVNYGVMGIYDETDPVPDANINGNNDLIKFRPDDFVMITNSDSKFGNVRLNNGNKIVTMNSDVYIQRVEYRFGRINMQSYNLKIDELYINLNSGQADYQNCNGCNSVEDMFIGDGLSSDKGLSLRVKGNGTYIFPIGVGTSGIDTDPIPTSKYTPVSMTISNFSDTGYVSVTPVNDTLSTTAHAGGDILTYYWSIKNNDFTTSPNVSYSMKYYDSDVSGNENRLVPGRVLSSDPYTRLYDDTNGKINKTNNTILFDLYQKNGALLTLENANYTAGKKNRFQGAVTKFYAVVRYGSWGDKNTWRQDAINGTIKKVPTRGSIAIIPNNIRVSVKNADGGIPEKPAEVRFEHDYTTNPIPDSENVPRLQFYDPGTYDIGIVTGTGMVSFNTTSNPTVIADFGNFGNNPNSFFMYWGGNATLTNIPTPIPSLLLENSVMTIADEINVGQNLIMHGNATCVPTQNITIGNDLLPGAWNGGKLRFPATGNPITITVGRNIDYTYVQNNGTRQIYVEDAVSTLVHKLIVNGDIIQDASDNYLFQLYNGTDRPKVVLELQGAGNHSYTRTSNSEPSLYRIVMNKDTSTVSSFTFNNTFSLNGETNTSTKALELKNGNLILNHSAIDITLNSGNYNFNIPATAELQINQGTVRIQGDNTGIFLDGKLFVNGGNAYFNGAGNGNLFIEYSASRKAQIEITSGNLVVGGQIRRQLNTEEGVLSYNQSGGIAEIGTGYPMENNRGVFEILNPGSSFSLTGGNLILAQSQPSAKIASFYFNPESLNLATGSSIIFGSTNTISTRNSFGIYAGKALQNVEISNVSGFSPSLKIWTVPLHINEDLIIGNGTSFDANGLDLFIAHDLDNNGIFNSNSNLTTFNGSSDQEIKGSSVSNFYKLTKTNSNTLRLQNAITVTDEFRLEAGNFEDNSFTATLKGNIYNVGTHIYGGSGDGILLKGSELQYISGSGTYGKLSIDNPYGIQLNVGYNLLVNNMLKLKNGVLNIGGNLLTIAKTATIFPENPFSYQNMIETNISFTDNGVKKYFPTGSGEFIYPIGAGGKYTPVKVITNSNPDSNGFLIAKASNERHPSIQEDAEAPENVEIPDTANVLQYYWSLTAQDFTNVSGNVEFYYDPIDTIASNAFYNISDYIPARLLESSNLWNKYDWVDFDEVAEKIVFKFENVQSSEITGDYTAGVQPDTALLKGAIPDMVATYETVASGNWSDGTIWSPQVPGGPRGAIVIINPSHTVVSDKNYALTHRIEINGRLETKNTFGNRLGLVSGTGTLSTESGLLPAGFYNKFFFAKSGGTLEYTGNTSYDALNNLAEVNNVRFSGTGDRRLPNLELRLVGSLWIDGDDANLKVINEYDNKLTVDGDITLGTGSFDAGTGNNAIVELGGSEPQTISGNFIDSNDLTITNAFNKLTVNNSAGVNVTSTIEINKDLTFNTGIIKVIGSNKLILNNILNTAVIGANCSNYVSGILSKKINDNDSFVFPIGKAGRCGKMEVFNTATSGAKYWDVEYFNEPADNGGMSTDAFSSPLTFVSKGEYWRVECEEASSTADLKLYWDDLSGISTDATDQKDTRIVKWTTGTPDEWIANSVEAQVNSTEHSINTTGAALITYAGAGSSHFFTFSTTAVLPLMNWTGLVSENWEDAGNWDTGKIPYSAADVVIPNVGSNFYPKINSEASCKKLTIDENSSLWIMAAHGLRANGNTIINGEFVLADNYTATGQFIDNGTITTGVNANIHVHHWLPANKYSYISSPLAAAVRDTFNNHYGTNPNFYKYVESNDDGFLNGIDNNWMDAWKFGDATLEIARGYASGWPGRGTYIKFQGGSFNTGNININVSNSNQGENSDGWNLVGNPYPSAVDAALFVTENAGSIDGALYFWDDDGSLGENYTPGDYATWNLAGSVSGQTAPDGGGTAKIPDGFIGMAQGFFVKAKNIGNNPLSFTNSMRTFGNGQFFNTKKTTKNNDIQRIRLDMQNDTYYNELLLTFSDLATDDYDNLYDARKMKANSNLSFYSILHNEAFSIQSQSTISSEKDYKAIPLGYELRESGDYSIRLRQIENISDAKFVYLDDKEAQILTDLRTDTLYSFSAKAGENKSRFEIVFSNKALTYDKIEVKSNIQIYAYEKNIVVQINTVEATEGEIQIVNLRGQVIESRTINNDYYFNIPVNAKEGIYLVKITNNGNIQTKKVFLK